MVGLDVMPVSASSRMRCARSPLSRILRSMKSSQMETPASWRRSSLSDDMCGAPAELENEERSADCGVRKLRRLALAVLPQSAIRSLCPQVESTLFPGVDDFPDAATEVVRDVHRAVRALRETDGSA